MITNENYKCSQGTAVTILSAIVDQAGNPVTTYTGAEALVSVLWPGGSRQVSLTPVTAWVNHSLGLISIAITAADTATLAVGRYQILTRVVPSGQDPIDGYGCTFEVTASPGSEATPPAYTTFSDLMRYGRSWLGQLQEASDQAGFAEQQGRARSWLDGIILDHYRVASMTLVVGCQAAGPRISGARSTWLQDELGQDLLIVTDDIKEAVAKKALSFICEAQIGSQNSQRDWARLARMYRTSADYILCCLNVSLDTNSDGFPDITVDLSAANCLYG